MGSAEFGITSRGCSHKLLYNIFDLKKAKIRKEPDFYGMI
jgi:hypothetical protein